MSDLIKPNKLKAMETRYKEALALLDGAYDIIEMYQPKHPAQHAWKEAWLLRVRTALSKVKENLSE